MQRPSPRPLCGRNETFGQDVEDVTSGLKLDPVAELPQQIAGFGADLPTPVAVLADTMDLDEAEAIRGPVVGLPDEAQVRQIRMVAAQRGLDLPEMRGATVGSVHDLSPCLN